MFLEASLLSMYFFTLLSFSFVTHPVNYCFLLVMGALTMSLYSYTIIGFSWYFVLFCLVYMGGVYVLFVFVSLHAPKPSYSLGISWEFGLVSFFVLWFFVLGLFYWGWGSCFMDSSHYLCSFFEGFSYSLFCLILMIGFMVISVVSSDKDSFCR